MTTYAVSRPPAGPAGTAYHMKSREFNDFGGPESAPDQPSGDDTMCRVVSCTTCGRSTWEGCGDHAAEVMAAVPESQRCQGHVAEATVERPDDARVGA